MKLLYLSLKSIAVIIGTFVILLIGFRVWAYTRETHEITAVAPKNGKLVPASDVQIFVQELGEPGIPGKKTVVFIHGTGAWGKFWDETTQTLAAADFYTVTLDTPPFGFSEKPTTDSFSTIAQAQRIIKTLEVLNISEATVVCHSFGCRAAMEATMSSQGLIQEIVMVDPALEIFDPTTENSATLLSEEKRANIEKSFESSSLYKLLQIKPLRETVISATATNPLLTKTLLQSLIYNKAAATPERVAVIQQPLTVKNSTEALGRLLVAFLTPSALSQSTNLDAYSSLELPVLLIWGAEDTITPVQQGENLVEVLPNSKLVIIPETGHIPYIENSREFNRVLLEFLER